MNGFINFLLNYYGWILAVLGISIVTIIGFLVDSKQKRKKKETLENKNSDEVKTVEPMPEVDNKNAVPVVDAKTQSIPTTIDNVIGGDGTYVNEQSQPVQRFEQVQSMQPVQPNQVLNNANNGIKTPVTNNQDIPTLNDQKPHFEPREVSIPSPASTSMTNNYNGVVAPKPVNAVPINQVGMQSQGQTMNSQVNTSVVNASQIANQTPVSVQPVQNMQVAQPQVKSIQNIPNQMPAPGVSQPVSPIPNVAPASPSAAVVNPQPVSEPQVSSTPNVGINFVTGDVPQNEDMWKL